MRTSKEKEEQSIAAVLQLPNFRAAKADEGIGRFAKAERLTSPVPTKMAPSERERLDRARDWLNERGIDATTSSLMRTWALIGLEALEAEIEASETAATGH